ncbi:MAG TPA: DUF6114 domain-containing protein [Candidatus Bathyarchaeia archaeon]
MSVEDKPVAAFILSLLGGIFILLGAFVMSMFAFGTGNMMGMMGMMSGTMAGSSGLMAMMMMGYSFAFAIVGLASGALVILGSVMLYNRPSESQIWSAVILAFSLLSILGSMGGFMVGLVMGVLGGTFGLVWKPATSSQMIGLQLHD